MCLWLALSAVAEERALMERMMTTVVSGKTMSKAKPRLKATAAKMETTWAKKKKKKGG